MMLFIGIATLAFLFSGGLIGFKRWFFQIYLLNILALVYSLFIRRFFASFIFVFMLLINYFNLASCTQIFINRDVSSERGFHLTYMPKQDLHISGENIEKIRSGRILLAPNAEAYFSTIKQQEQILTLIQIDWENISYKEKKTAIKQLERFILSLDNSTVVYGDFGVPAWSRSMKNLMENTGLKVKNRLVFSYKGRTSILFSIPSFYVLSFQNVGVKSIKAKPARVDIDISIN